MSQQPDPVQPTTKFDSVQPMTTMTLPVWMVPHIEKLNELLAEVHDMPPGGDLEGLIESHLVGLNRQCYDTALRLRAQTVEEQASAQTEAFPPSGLSALPEAAAPRPPQTTRDSDPAR
jgi:hypothetical protein